MVFGFQTWTLILIFVGAVLGGCIASVFYNSTYNYVSKLAGEDGKYIRYFGIYIGIVQFCNLVGNTVSFFFIEKLGQIGYVTGLDIAICLISCLFLTFTDVHLNQQNY